MDVKITLPLGGMKKSRGDSHSENQGGLQVTACFRKAALSLIVFSCVSCSPGIKVTRVQGDAPVVGNPWNLPMTQFNITITRHVTGCGPRITGAVEVIATTATVVDEQQRYVLQSDGLWATSDITSNLAANGVSTGLNATSADTTATVISNVVTTFGKVLVGVASAGILNLDKRKELCTTKVRDAVNELFPEGGTPLKAQVDADIAALAEATAKVELLIAQSKADAKLKPQLVAALKAQADERKKLADSQNKLTSNLKLTSHLQVVSWPRAGNEFRRDVAFDLSPDVLANWTGLKRDTEQEKKDFADVYAKEKGQFAVYLALLRPAADGSWKAPNPPSSPDTAVGVPVRLAQQGRLLVCSEQTCPSEIASSGIKNEKIKPFDQVVLQMGQVYTVPLTGGTFRSQTGAITLDPNGLPTTIQVIEKTAVASAVTGAAKDVATQLSALPAEVRAAELARIKAKTDEANARSALATAQANLAVADQTSSRAAQTALVKAQTDLAMAQLNAGLPLQTASLTAQTNFINAQAALGAAQTNAQIALINAQIALATAQANAATIDQTSVLAAQATLLNAQTALINAAVALAKAQASVP